MVNSKLAWMPLSYIVVLLMCCNVISEMQPVVRTLLGEMKGFHMKTQEGRVISAFSSIPYAQPPVGDLRFQAPIPIGPWEGILNASRTTPSCVQRNPYIRQQEIVGQEDCLYLNIYTPYSSNELLDTKDLLPVMVFIHGGGWMCGDSRTESYGPEYLLDHGVILVTVNYRLGPLGFLSMGNELCPGNNGLKDQQEALRFLQKTIENFGGDKNSVTIFGESAGGASAHYHMLSKNSHGLFHRAISESGTATVPWAMGSPVEAELHSQLLLKFTGCDSSVSPHERLACLRSKDSYDIINTEFLFYAWDYEPMTPFKAVEEPDLPGAFITKPVREITNINPVPWLTGLTSNEGCLKSVWITSNETRFRHYLSNFSKIAPVTFYYDIDRDDITNLISEQYNMGSIITDNLKKAILDMYTDAYFAYPMVDAVESVIKHSKAPVYLYELAYRATNSFSQIFGDADGDYGVCHADDLMYLFPIHFLQHKPSATDLEVGKLIRTVWTNFAKTGNPNKPVEIPVKWNKTTPEMNYVKIDRELTVKKNLGARSRFWGTLPIWRQRIAAKDEL